MFDNFGKLSVILPAYNEEENIYLNALTTSNSIGLFLPRYEIIVVNDGSIDQTLNEANRAAKEDGHITVIDSQPNKGKGHVLCAGTEAANGEYVAFCDSDLDLHPKQLEKFIQIMIDKDADIVIGSKMHPESDVEYPWHRKVISWGYYFVLRILFRLKVKDTQTGLKLFKADAIKPVMEKILVKRFAYDIEVLAILNRRGYKIESAPIQLVYQRGRFGSRIHLKDIFNVAKDTMAIFYRLYILRYYDEKE